MATTSRKGLSSLNKLKNKNKVKRTKEGRRIRALEQKLKSIDAEINYIVANSPGYQGQRAAASLEIEKEGIEAQIEKLYKKVAVKTGATFLLRKGLRVSGIGNIFLFVYDHPRIIIGIVLSICFFCFLLYMSIANFVTGVSTSDSTQRLLEVCDQGNLGSTINVISGGNDVSLADAKAACFGKHTTDEIESGITISNEEPEPAPGGPDIDFTRPGQEAVTP